MGLVKHRPEVTLRGPRTIRVGVPTRLRATLHCKEALPVDGVDLELLGHIVAHGGEAGLQGAHGAFCRLVARLVRGRQELPQGEHHYDATFELPPDTPGTYSGKALSVSWSSKVHVDIPWWPDRRAYFSMHVTGQGVPPRRTAEVFVSDTRGPAGRGPYAEVSLGTTTIEGGGTINGRVALSNVGNNRYRAVRFALAARESMFGHTVGSIHRVAQWEIAVANAVENEGIPFRLRLPPEIPAGFHRHRASLEWQLEIELVVAWSRNPILYIPLEVHNIPPDGSQAAVEAVPLAVGSERLQLVWRRAAHLAGFDYADERLAKLIDGHPLTIRREHRRWRGVGLVVRADLRPVDIGLSQRKGRLRCRDEGQSQRLAEATDALTERRPVAEASDGWIRWVIEETGTRVDPLVEVARDLEALVRAFVEARAELPPPADVADLEEDFARAARRLGATFERAGMDIFGTRDEMAFSLETQWDGYDGDLAHTVLSVRPIIPVDSRFHGTWRDGQRPDELPSGLAELLDDITGLAIAADAVELYFPPRPDDLDALTERLEALIAVGLALSMRAGGYR